jgi:hypothetical protein
LSPKGIQTISSIKEPTKRVYAQVRVGIQHMNKVDDQFIETDNTKAMKILCEVYMRKIDYLIENKLITTKKNPKPLEDGTVPVYFMSTDATTPMVAEIMDKTTKEMKTLEQPSYWITVPAKKFYENGEVKKESVHFQDQYYFDAAKNAPDLSKPVMSFEYGTQFYNIDDFYHHPRTGKKIYKKLGDYSNNPDEPHLDNTNIHKYITRGSALVGAIKFEMVIVRQAKLEMSLHGKIHLRAGTYSLQEGEDDECLDEFSELYGNINLKKNEDLDDSIDIGF